MNRDTPHIFGLHMRISMHPEDANDATASFRSAALSGIPGQRLYAYEKALIFDELASYVRANPVSGRPSNAGFSVWQRNPFRGLRPFVVA